jgi:Predicted RNA-binding protein
MQRIEGKTLEEVLSGYASSRGVEESDITYFIVEEKKGLLGIGNKVIVDLYCKKDIVDFLYNYLGSYFNGIELDTEIDIRVENDSFKIMLNAENNAILIGKAGQTLQALNTITRAAASSTFKKRVHILIDVNNYKSDRYSKVKAYARNVAKTVQTTRVTATLDSMPNDERKVIHQYLTTMKNIRTESVGEGRDRRLKIIYVENEE